ncbi:BC10 family protein [Limosilactobacillus reuteri]|nr:BC10 family protein [Limosilactobacillus reuteri]
MYCLFYWISNLLASFRVNEVNCTSNIFL